MVTKWPGRMKYYNGWLKGPEILLLLLLLPLLLLLHLFCVILYSVSFLKNETVNKSHKLWKKTYILALVATEGRICIALDSDSKRKTVIFHGHCFWSSLQFGDPGNLCASGFIYSVLQSKHAKLNAEPTTMPLNSQDNRAASPMLKETALGNLRKYVSPPLFTE